MQNILRKINIWWFILSEGEKAFYFINTPMQVSLILTPALWLGSSYGTETLSRWSEANPELFGSLIFLALFFWVFLLFFTRWALGWFLALTYNGNNCLVATDDLFPASDFCFLADNDGDGVKTLNDLAFDNALDDVKPVPPVAPSDKPFIMAFQWAEDSDMPGLNYTVHCLTPTPRLCDNAFQGDTLPYTMEFTLNQLASQ